jgi:hypothetical protein
MKAGSDIGGGMSCHCKKLYISNRVGAESPQPSGPGGVEPKHIISKIVKRPAEMNITLAAGQLVGNLFSSMKVNEATNVTVGC